MSLETNNTGSSPALLHGKQDNVVDTIYDFSTLRNELDDGSSVEDNEDSSIVFEHVEDDDDFEFEFATDTDVLSSATFEEEAFGVKRPGKQDIQAHNRQTPSSIWKKDPFASNSSKDPRLLKGDNRLKKVPYRSNAPLPSNRQISEGISFASIISGTRPDPPQVGNEPLSPPDAALDDTTSDDHGPQTIDPPSVPVPAPTLHDKEPSQPTSPALDEPAPDELPMNESHQSRPTVYSLTDIEAKMVQQPTAPQKNLLYQLLPGLAPQQQPTSSQPPPTAPVDINSFFKKHQSQQTEQANHVSQPSIHKPNLTPEQERKQKEEDDTKSSYDGLMTTKNMEFIDHLEQSQLATHTQGSSGDFYYQMYQAHINNGRQQPHPQSAHHHPHPSAMNTANDMSPLSMGENEKRAELDQILKDIMKDRSDTMTGGNDSKEPSRSKNDRQLLLKSIESIYFLVLEVEQSSRHPGAALPSHFGNTQPSAKSPSETREETMDKIWARLTTSQSSFPMVISILSVNKGMSLIARLLPHLDDHQRLIVMTTIAYHFVDLLLQGSDATVSQQQRQNMDYLHPSITGCLENTLFSASLSYITHIISSLSRNPDFELLITTVTGQRFVGSLLFHGRGKRQQHQSSILAVDADQWQVAFDTLFNATRTCFPQIREMARLDNMGLWTLLNSMTACCNEQQKEAIANDFREPISVAMRTISDMTRTHPLPYLPYPVQAAYPILNELWVNLGLSNGFGESST